MKIENQKTVYVAWTNTDMTEGKGFRIPMAVCECQSTAERLGQKAGVMGCNAPVTEETAVRINGIWCAPVQIHTPNDEDKKIEERREAARQAEEKALKLGMSKEDIAALKRSL